LCEKINLIPIIIHEVETFNISILLGEKLKLKENKYIIASHKDILVNDGPHNAVVVP
jgi:hypothetical protein